MRIALLPSGSDPFVLAYWLRNFATWQNEVDQLRVVICGQTDPAVLDYMRERIEAFPNAVLTDVIGGRADHGQVLNKMVSESPDGIVCLLEDDAYVRAPGVMAERFRRIKDGECDVIGTSRGNVDPPLIPIAIERFGPAPIGLTGETGHSLFPCFAFVRKSDLERTDRHYGAMGWRAGERIPGLDVDSFAWQDSTGEWHDTLGADTFTSATWQLRALGLRVEAESAYRSDSAHNRAAQDNAPWFHVGSLSTGVGCALMVDRDSGYQGLADMIRRNSAGFSDRPGGPGELYDWCKRMSWWQRCWSKWDGGLPDYHRAYGESIAAFMADTGMSQADVDWWTEHYNPLISWEE